jgi:hypothetical protein
MKNPICSSSTIDKKGRIIQEDWYYGEIGNIQYIYLFVIKLVSFIWRKYIWRFNRWRPHPCRAFTSLETSHRRFLPEHNQGWGFLRRIKK